MINQALKTQSSKRKRKRKRNNGVL